MTVNFRDFVPEVLDAGGIFTKATYEGLAELRKRMNQWIEGNGIKVLNVETILMPNLNSPREEGSEDAAVWSSGDFATTWNQFIRVWYVE